MWRVVSLVAGAASLLILLLVLRFMSTRDLALQGSASPTPHLTTANARPPSASASDEHVPAAAPASELPLPAKISPPSSPPADATSAASPAPAQPRPLLAESASAAEQAVQLTARIKEKLRLQDVQYEPVVVCDGSSCTVTFPTAPSAAEENRALQAMEIWTLAYSGTVGTSNDVGATRMVIELQGLY